MSQERKVTMANPASVYCIEHGGKLRIDKTDKGEIGMCVLPSGIECEEWAYFNKKCPPKEKEKETKIPMSMIPMRPEVQEELDIYSNRLANLENEIDLLKGKMQVKQQQLEKLVREIKSLENRVGKKEEEFNLIQQDFKKFKHDNLLWYL